MLQLYDFSLILNDLLVTINHDKGLSIHLLIKSTFIIEKQFILCDPLLYSFFELIKLFIWNFLTPLLTDLIDFRLNLLNFVFFLLNLSDKVLNGGEAALLVNFIDFGLHFLL